MCVDYLRLLLVVTLAYNTHAAGRTLLFCMQSSYHQVDIYLLSQPQTCQSFGQLEALALLIQSTAADIRGVQ